MSPDAKRHHEHDLEAACDRPRGGDVVIAHESGDGSGTVAVSVVPGGPQFRVESHRAALQLLQPFAKKLRVDVWVGGNGSSPTRVVAGRRSG